MVDTPNPPRESAAEGDHADPPDALATAYVDDEKAIRATARWTMAGAGSLATLAVTKIRIDDLHGLHGPTAVLWAAAGLGLIGSPWAVLLVAARVLAAPRPTFHHLARREADAAHPGRIRLSDVPDRAVSEILDRRSELLGRHDSIQSAYAAVVASRTAYETALAQDRPTQALEQLRRRVEFQRSRTQAVEAAAAALALRTRWRRLTRALIGCGPVFAASLLTMVYLSTRDSGTAIVTAPVAVQVQVPMAAARRLGLPPACSGTHRGIAVDGPLVTPVVVLPADGACPAQRIGPADDLVIVPVLSGQAG
jgi:hypothetical protein